MQDYGDDAVEKDTSQDDAEEKSFLAHVPVPSQKDVGSPVRHMQCKWYSHGHWNPDKKHTHSRRCSFIAYLTILDGSPLSDFSGFDLSQVYLYILV